MLISFSVENFRSIRRLQKLSLEEGRRDDSLEWSNVFEAGNRRLLKCAAVYGPNASGKSNLIRALAWFRSFVLNSSRESQAGEQIDVVPFLLSTATETEPSHFEVEFFWKDFEYRYGFTVTSIQVVTEWLFRRQPGSKPAKLFTREGGAFDISSEFFREGKGLEERTRTNALFLSVCAQLNGSESTSIVAWMRRLRTVSGLDDRRYLTFTANRIAEGKHSAGALDFARQADPTISALRVKMDDAESPMHELLPLRKAFPLRLSLAQPQIIASHRKLDEDGKEAGQVEFDFRDDESQGTQKFITISGPLAHTLEQGSILIVDELEARLHPRLTQAIVDLFHSPLNRQNAQLVCATHDVTLLDPDRFRRDQIWFCEKDAGSATSLYRLSEFDPQKVRATTSFARQYLLGLFGAVPKLAHFKEAAENAISG